MISGHLIGPNVNTNPGLGNQMFPMAAVCSLAWENNDKALFRHGHYQEIYMDNIFKNTLFDNNIEMVEDVYREPYFNYAPIPYCENRYIDGYFQSYKYFEKYADKIKGMFLPSTLEEVNLKLEVPIFDKCVGGIHIRRTDYLGFSHIHPELTRENYYNKAISILQPKVDNWLICSDDIEWAKENFSDLPNVTFSEGRADYEDMWLLSLCDHFIIANSTFSWWSAWLSNTNTDKEVICPQTWFGKTWYNDNPGQHVNDLIPTNWRKV